MSGAEDEKKLRENICNIAHTYLQDGVSELEQVIKTDGKEVPDVRRLTDNITLSCSSIEEGIHREVFVSKKNGIVDVKVSKSPKEKAWTLAWYWYIALAIGVLVLIVGCCKSLQTTPNAKWVLHMPFGLSIIVCQER